MPALRLGLGVRGFVGDRLCPGERVRRRPRGHATGGHRCHLGCPAVHHCGPGTGADQHDHQHGEEVPGGSSQSGDDRVDSSEHTDSRPTLSLDERDESGEQHDDRLQELRYLGDQVLKADDKVLDGVHSSFPHMGVVEDSLDSPPVETVFLEQGQGSREEGRIQSVGVRPARMARTCSSARMLARASTSSCAGL